MFQSIEDYPSRCAKSTAVMHNGKIIKTINAFAVVQDKSLRQLMPYLESWVEKCLKNFICK